jgi:hypothetical protein
MIFAVKLICDGTALIVRGEDGHSPSLNLHAIEAYRPPAWGTTQFQPPPVQCNYLHSNQTNYDISAMYMRQKTSDNPSEEEVIGAVGYYPSVTISVESSDPNKGITQYRLYATHDPANLEQKFAYQWPVTVWQGHYSEHDQYVASLFLISIHHTNVTLGIEPRRVAWQVLIVPWASHIRHQEEQILPLSASLWF